MSHKRKNQIPENKDIEYKIIQNNLVYEDERNIYTNVYTVTINFGLFFPGISSITLAAITHLYMMVFIPRFYHSNYLGIVKIIDGLLY